jgi:hypothetical protein
VLWGSSQCPESCGGGVADPLALPPGPCCVWQSAMFVVERLKERVDGGPARGRRKSSATSLLWHVSYTAVYFGAIRLLYLYCNSGKEAH